MAPWGASSVLFSCYLGISDFLFEAPGDQQNPSALPESALVSLARVLPWSAIGNVVLVPILPRPATPCPSSPLVEAVCS